MIHFSDHLPLSDKKSWNSLARPQNESAAHLKSIYAVIEGQLPVYALPQAFMKCDSSMHHLCSIIAVRFLHDDKTKCEQAN